MDIRKREAMNATRTAFGADYEANLRKEAGPNPEKLARRKHQISSLYHQAKMKVTAPVYFHVHHTGRLPWTLAEPACSFYRQKQEPVNQPQCCPALG